MGYHLGFGRGSAGRVRRAALRGGERQRWSPVWNDWTWSHPPAT